VNKIKINTKLRRLISFLVAGLFIGGVALAALSNKVLLKGAMFTTSTVELKFLRNLSSNVENENLTSELSGISFDGITNDWITTYPVKLVNKSGSSMNVSSYANYTTANDPASLRYSLNVEIFKWNDSNNNGVLDEGELGDSLGRKTFVKWKTEGFALGSFEPNVVQSYVLQFTAESITDSKQGATGSFDFEFGVMN
jgi:hypothetical protein